MLNVERDLKLAQADCRIEEAERNIQQVASLVPTLYAQGFSTDELKGQIGLMSEALHHLKEQRRLIEATLH